MKLAVVSWNRRIEKEVSRAGFVINKKSPDIVLCVGGDGTFLYGEQIYPGVPKLLVKHKCTDCGDHKLGVLLKKIERREFAIKEEIKVVGTINKNPRKRLVGLNEINIHYRLPCAIGLEVAVNGKHVARVLGDGLVVATPYGSTAYFRSITRKTFSRGLGLAFNTPVMPVKPLIVSEDSVIRVRVVKHSGWMAADCNKKIFPLKTGDFVEIKKYPKPARIIVLKSKGEKIKL